MDDIIFLIIAVAISIFAAINKNKKKQMAGQIEEAGVQEFEAQRRRNFMDQFLGEDFLEEEEEIQAPPVRVKQVPPPVVFTSSNETSKGLYYELPKFKSTLPDRPKHATITTSRKLNEVDESISTEEESPSYLEDFSLRKAIVFSQIIQPRYEW